MLSSKGHQQILNLVDLRFLHKLVGVSLVQVNRTAGDHHLIHSLRPHSRHVIGHESTIVRSHYWVSMSTYSSNQGWLITHQQWTNLILIITCKSRAFRGVWPHRLPGKPRTCRGIWWRCGRRRVGRRHRRQILGRKRRFDGAIAICSEDPSHEWA